MAAVSTSQQQAGISSLNSIGKNEVVFLEPQVSNLPLNIQEQLYELENQFKEGDLTEKGYRKRRSTLLMPYLIPYHDPKGTLEADSGCVIEPEMESLPKKVVEELKKLQEELENEEITKKGLNKRRQNLLAPYMLKEPPKCELPTSVQEEYESLEVEYREGDITDKGFKKKRIKLLKPYLVAVNPYSYTNVKPTTTTNVTKRSGKAKQVIGIKSVMDGQQLFKCAICFEVFKQAHSFSGHCRIHRAESVKNFQCSICDAEYSTRSHLKFHMYKHTGNFPFNCRYCGKGFAGRSQYKSHEKRHTGESSYTCNKCGSRFLKKEHFVLHTENACIQKWNPNGTEDESYLPKDTDNRKSPQVYKNVPQNCQAFDSGEDISDELHMQVQDLSQINMTTINLADVTSTPVTVVNRDSGLTTPTIGVTGSLDTGVIKQEAIAMSGVRLNVDPRNEKYKIGGGSCVEIRCTPV